LAAAESANRVGGTRPQFGEQSAAAASTADFQPSWLEREAEIAALAKLANDGLAAGDIAVPIGASAVGRPESNGIAL
jgi:hypothetical protein